MKEIFKKMRTFSLQRNIDIFLQTDFPCFESVTVQSETYSMQLLQLTGAQRIHNDAIGWRQYDIILKKATKQNLVFNLVFSVYKATKMQLTYSKYYVCFIL